ncbi:MAG: hypothetical protein K2Q25_05530, partial [Mycobacteriaceae bacterium]|nr:hypothetical protein [Mycobacteriaceae bacterium]
MDVFLAVAALFATAGTLGMHAKASFGSDSVPTPYDVAIATGQGAAVVGQAALVSGEMGWLNCIDPSFRDLTPAEREALAVRLNSEYDAWYAALSDAKQGTVNNLWESRRKYPNGHVFDLGNENLKEADNFSDLFEYEIHHMGRNFTLPEMEIGEAVPPYPRIDPESLPTKAGPSPVGEFFAPNVWYLSVALVFVDAVTALFGLLEQPDRGQRLSRGVTQFATGYMELEPALPDVEQWKSEAALLYGIDTRIMQEIAAAARSKDSRFKRIINSQAFGLELMQTALAALTVGLTICVYRALYMESCLPGSSNFFQKWAARLGMVAACGIGVAMVVWVAENTGKLEYLKSEYRDLADKVPSAIPDVPPAVGALNSASTVSRFGNLNLSALPD